jgi:uracil-DNA glycosylase
MRRAASHVVEELLVSMRLFVRDYHPAVGKTGRTLNELIRGTAFFPGGSGLWRGSNPFGQLPDFFPEAPLMIIGHNFDSIAAHATSMDRGGEAQSLFWRILLAYLSAAAIRPDRCFFTNALMGLKHGSAVGSMPAVAAYHDQCQAYLARQIEIVNPSMIVTLGQKARGRVAKLGTRHQLINLLHPSARELKPLSSRCAAIEHEAKPLREPWPASCDGVA